jgi:hypothetical protein
MRCAIGRRQDRVEQQRAKPDGRPCKSSRSHDATQNKKKVGGGGAWRWRWRVALFNTLERAQRGVDGVVKRKKKYVILRAPQLPPFSRWGLFFSSDKVSPKARPNRLSSSLYGLLFFTQRFFNEFQLPLDHKQFNFLKKTAMLQHSWSFRVDSLFLKERGKKKGARTKRPFKIIAFFVFFFYSFGTKWPSIAAKEFYNKTRAHKYLAHLKQVKYFPTNNKLR